jgi:hypothetical protein
MPLNTYIIPANLPGKKVDVVKNSLPTGIGIKVKTSSDSSFHDPSAVQLEATIAAMGPNSKPGDAKTNGEWIGVIINPV